LYYFLVGIVIAAVFVLSPLGERRAGNMLACQAFGSICVKSGMAVIVNNGNIIVPFDRSIISPVIQSDVIVELELVSPYEVIGRVKRVKGLRGHVGIGITFKLN
jgi:hypothetical protein